jgi:dTDP-glucose pyrophosphorylase
MNNFSTNIISQNATLKQALKQLNEVPLTLTLFVVNEDQCLVGTLTDGDIRRGILENKSTEGLVKDFMFTKFKYIHKDGYTLDYIQFIQKLHIHLLPVLDDDFKIIRIVDLSQKQTLLPLDAVIMAGGEGTRLRPLTIDTPKPLLKVGGKPIIEYNIDRLNSYGIYNLTISIKYLGQQLIDYFKDGSYKNMNIGYVEENEPLGTIGAIRLIEKFDNPYILVMNSDLLTNINYELFFKTLIDKDADMIVATTPYEVKIPYGVIETEGDQIKTLQEKPTYTYYSNAGIYIFKREYVDLIPENEFFNATDFLEKLIGLGKKVLHYPILEYWLDIGKHDDYEKAQQDVKHIKF